MSKRVERVLARLLLYLWSVPVIQNRMAWHTMATGSFGSQRLVAASMVIVRNASRLGGKNDALMAAWYFLPLIIASAHFIHQRRKLLLQH